MHINHAASCTAFLAVILLVQGCTTQSYVQVAVPPARVSTESALPIRLEACRDRTGTKGRDLAAEASLLLAQRLRGTSEFILRDDAALVLSCDVTQFVEGNAFKRWLAPGWGSTVGQIAIMLSDANSQSAVMIIHGNSTVSGGGLYTIGADDTILKSAVDDVMARLRDWAAGPDAALRKR